ncbi:MAG: DUF4350 domain-containing protein [Verrucomicrobiota bacterium]|nr:DUF4350 domain-containing protein [Verrucomicrobiota bacterium]
MKYSLLFALICFPLTSPSQVLFDATKAEMAGNADWIIDADAHDLRVGSTDGSGTRGAGNESDPQRIPTPSIAGITASTPETYWQGALSAWAVALAKAGVTSIETLPVFISPTSNVRSRITFGDSTNPQDLSNYRMYVVCEPNILFTAAEKTAILQWVFNGGRLFMVADHNGSDRNGDGVDSVGVWNDLLGTTSVFGFRYNLDDVSPVGVADSTATNPLTHGPAGTVASFKYVNGATMTISDPTVAHAAVWETASHASNQVMALYGTYGAGKFVAVGDSSPIDDGTGDPNDTLFDGWDDANGDDGHLVMNGSLWLLQSAPVQVTGAVSIKTHGTVGDFAIPLPLSGIPGVECRTGGGTNAHTVVFTFANTLTSVAGAAVTTGSGTVSSRAIGADAHQYIVNLTGVVDAQTITLSLSNVTDSAGNNSPTVLVSMGLLLGDTTGDRFVNGGDSLQTRNRAGQAVDATNFRSDVNVDGFVNSGDSFIVRARSGSFLP